MSDMNILIIDNYDSFTYNLYQAIGALCRPGASLAVVRNDRVDVGDSKRREYTHVVLSPGPGHPGRSGASLVASDIWPDTPLLGVCLGHQALAFASGARIVRSPRPAHGRAVSITHDGGPPFDRAPPRFDAGLYHSLLVEEVGLPREWIISARSPHGDIMALRHAERPHYGVQFHPESFLTPCGGQILAAFLES